MGALERLVNSFDSEDGNNEEVYIATLDMVESLLGNSASIKFINIIDATDGNFYFNRFKYAYNNDEATPWNIITNFGM